MKWNQDVRKVMYRRMFEKFGACKSWVSRTNPTGDSVDMAEFLEEMSVGFAKITGEPCTVGAVQNQLNWGLGAKQSVIKDPNHLKNYILNRAAALEVGLITYNDLPDYVLFEKE